MTKMYFISYSWTRGEVFKLSSESKHLILLFQLVDQLKQFVPNLPVSAAHKTLTFRFLFQVIIKNGLINSGLLALLVY